jgi:hypothetical protein
MYAALGDTTRAWEACMLIITVFVFRDRLGSRTDH